MSCSKLFDTLKPQLPSTPNAQPTNNALDAFKLVAAQQLSEALSIPLQQAFDGIEAGKKGSDLSVPIPKFRLKGKPQELAAQVVQAFKPNDYLAKVDVQGINVQWHFQHATFSSLVLTQINELTHLRGNSYGSNTLGKGKKMVIDFASPNIAKPFHAGHLRSTIIGAFLTNLYQANGWETVRLNYLGDWGKQFGILAVGFRKYGSEEELEKDAIKHLYDVYVKVNNDARAEVAAAIQKSRAERRAKGEADVPADDADPTKPENDAANAASPTHQAAREVFSKMENGDETELATWRKFRELSIVKYEETFKRLNVGFDVYAGESQVPLENQREIVNRLVQSNLAYQDKGALMIDLEKWKLSKTIVQKSDGTTTYLSRDLAGAYMRMEQYKPDKLIYVVAVRPVNFNAQPVSTRAQSQQDLYFQQVFKILDLMGFPLAKQMEHISFGMVQGMSTRKGTAVFLEQILDEAKETMHEQMRKSEDKYVAIEDPEGTADVLGMSAVKIQDMQGKRINNYNFDWARMTSYLGDTGPYLQYAHVRICSIVRKSTEAVSLPPPTERDSINTSLLSEPKARDVLALLSQYPDVVKQAFDKAEPTTIVTWAFRLCHAISSAYEVLLVRDQTQELAQARLFLYVCARDVLGSAMRLLTLTPLERM